MKKIKVGIVNYLNTAPLIYGLENAPIKDRIELVPDYPSRLADALAHARIDLGLVPVAIIPELKEYHIVGNHCIGCDGPVASVCLFSDVPIGEVQTVLLDYQSRTSVELAKILLRDYWQSGAELVAARPGYMNDIRGRTAGLVIGDRSFKQRKTSAYIYDLGEAWKDHTGLPFVFAAWVSNLPIGEEFTREFDRANAMGFECLDEVIASHPYPLFDLRDYYTRYISYSLDAQKRNGLRRFLDLLGATVTG